MSRPECKVHSICLQAVNVRNGQYSTGTARCSIALSESVYFFVWTIALRKQGVPMNLRHRHYNTYILIVQRHPDPHAPTALKATSVTADPTALSTALSITDGVVIFVGEAAGAASAECDNFGFFFFFKSAVKDDIRFQQRTRNVERTYPLTLRF